MEQTWNVEVRCLDCDYSVPSEDVFDGLDLEEGAPLYPNMAKPECVSGWRTDSP